jgi:KamA family protein
MLELQMSWKKILGHTVTSVQELEQYINFTAEEKSQLEEIAGIHPIRITKHVLELMDKNDPEDPIRKMYLPSLDELDLSGAYDTSGEADNTVASGLQHKYDPTALLLSTNVCAVYCRYCFRKRMVGISNDEVLSRFDDAIAYIGSHTEISNVLITGGDAFMLETSTIRSFLERLAEIPHLKYIRFGTKTLTSLPQRITEDKELIRLFREHNEAGKPRIYVFTHINHPREIVPETVESVNLLNSAGVNVSCQSVLLKGVNDSPEVLVELMDSLVAAGIVPYYLFQCRPVKRVQKSFQLPIPEGLNIVEEAKKNLSGMAKRFKFAMSHKIGKIEIIGQMNNEIIFKLHNARDTGQTGRLFTLDAGETGGWLPQNFALEREMAEA